MKITSRLRVKFFATIIYMPKNKVAQRRYREKDNAKKREKYHNDKEYREKRLAQIRKYHKENPEVNRRSRKKREKEKLSFWKHS